MRAILLAAGILLAALPAAGQDVRTAVRRAEADREAARAEQRAAEAEILADREALTRAVEEAESRRANLAAELRRLEGAIADAESRRDALEEQWSARELEFREISGTVRVVARDLEALIRQSLTSARAPERAGRIAPLLAKGYFPDIDDIAILGAIFLDEIARSGEVHLARDAEFVGRAGETVRGEILTLGCFLAAYRTDGETGFLRYSPEEQRFFALTARPPWAVRRALDRYLDGESAAVPIDFSSGGALRQLTRHVSLRNQLRAGGPIVWPILAIGLLSLLIIVHRTWYLTRVHGNSDRVMGEVTALIAAGDWTACRERLDRFKEWPVVNVIRAGITARREDRATLESILQEAILRELPRLERYLSVLSIFGAVAPLLGLLGTVTGMIGTFRVITLHGTGDPKLMSGGISEALITTELGLIVAIPIMLLHTFLSRRVDHIVADMEQKAIGLSNIILGQRRHGTPVADR